MGKRTRSNASRDITDIMLPTTGVIEFDNVSYNSSPTSSTYSPTIFSFPSPTFPSESDDAWNLVPYHVSWGHEYHAYRAGRLPGPDGDCIFLRSPTPLKNQRTTEACKKCRERKAKCSGTRPACSRCSARDYCCEYASEVSPERSVVKSGHSRRDLLASPPRDRVHIVSQGAMLGGEQSIPIKFEEGTVHSLDLLACGSPTSAYWDNSGPTDEFLTAEPWMMPYSEPSPISSDEYSSSMYEPQASTLELMYPDTHAPDSLPQSPIFAPQPVRHTSLARLGSPCDSSSDGSTTFLGSSAFSQMSGTTSPNDSSRTGSSLGPLELDMSYLPGLCFENTAPHYLAHPQDEMDSMDGYLILSPSQALHPYANPPLYSQPIFGTSYVEPSTYMPFA